MSADADIDDALKQFKKMPPQTFPAKVVSVDKDNDTIVVIDNDDFEFDEVRLTASIDEVKTLVIYPKEGSTVLVSKIGAGDHVYFASCLSEVESIEGVIGETDFLINTEGIKGSVQDTKFLINSDGYKLDKGSDNLAGALAELHDEVGKLCDEVSKIVVSVGTTVNVGAVNAIKQKVTGDIKSKIENLLK